MLTLQQVFELGLKIGIAADPRGGDGVKRHLARIKGQFDDLKEDERQYFDKNRLANPYDDSRIHVGDLRAPVKRVLAGIDIGAGEILLASQLNERGKKIDAIIAHHPIGGSLAALADVMDMVVDVYEQIGVPVHAAEKIMEDRIREVGRGVHASNHYQIIDMARLLGVNLMNTHTITDNLVHDYLEKHLEKKKSQTISDLMKALMEVPEYQEAKRRGAGPKIFAGAPNHRIGKIHLEMTGGTNPSNKVYQELSRAGISTIVGMHMRDESMEKAREIHMNVVIAGHISSDSLGMNLFLDELEKKGVEVVPCGGLIRVSRVKRKS